MIGGDRRYHWVGLLLVRITLCAVFTAAAAVHTLSQTLPELQITSPTNDAIFNPGQAIPITVASPAGLSFNSVAVVGATVLGLSNIATSVPAQFSLTIPTTAATGEYALTAFGISASGQSFHSVPLFVDVEYAGPALGLQASLPSIFFKAKGESASMSFVATFDVGVDADVTASTMMSYVSSDTNVATVDASSGGLIVTAVGPGNAAITATYGQGATSIPLSIPVIGSRALTSSPSLVSFAGQGVGTISAPQIVTLINSGNPPINISGVAVSGDFSQTNTCISTSPIATGATCAINVTFVPTAVGTRSGTISISDDSNEPGLTVQLSGTGITDFSISASPATQSVILKNTTTYNVSVASIGGFTGTVLPSVVGLPASTTASFNPTSISGGSGASTLKIVTSSKTPLGSFTLSVTGTSGALKHSVSVTLTVTR
jgi:Bacterial Ig-like domain (group 2)